jgi:uncharacterized protein (DUF1501 family)
MRRRDFLKLVSASTSLTIAGRLYAAPQADSRLLVIFLRGAYDAANVVIPISSDFYYQSRPTLAIARPNKADDNAALPLDRDWGLHPALKEALYPIYQQKQLAFVPFAGTDDLSRSHFETQDTIELGQSINGSRNYRSGFMSRLAEQLANSHPMAFTDQLPLAFHGGNASIPNMALNFVGKPNIDDRQVKLIESMYQGTELAPQVAQGFTVRDQVYKEVTAEMQEANRNAVSPKGFELAASRIGGLMKEQFNLGFVDVGGWDTHVNQGNAKGYLAGRLGELGRGVAAFAKATGPVWNNTTVVVISEFGRTFRENGDRGTDHGHGSAYWVVGGSVRGGRMVGDQIRVEQKTLFQNRDYPVLNEYRAVLGGLFRRIYGLGDDRLQKIFPDVKPKELTLV